MWAKSCQHDHLSLCFGGPAFSRFLNYKISLHKALFIHDIHIDKGDVILSSDIWKLDLKFFQLLRVHHLFRFESQAFVVEANFISGGLLS